MLKSLFISVVLMTAPCAVSSQSLLDMLCAATTPAPSLEEEHTFLLTCTDDNATATITFEDPQADQGTFGFPETIVSFQLNNEGGSINITGQDLNSTLCNMAPAYMSNLLHVNISCSDDATMASAVFAFGQTFTDEQISMVDIVYALGDSGLESILDVEVTTMAPTSLLAALCGMTVTSATEERLLQFECENDTVEQVTVTFNQPEDFDDTFLLTGTVITLQMHNAGGFILIEGQDLNSSLCGATLNFPSIITLEISCMGSTSVNASFVFAVPLDDEQLANISSVVIVLVIGTSGIESVTDVRIVFGSSTTPTMEPTPSTTPSNSSDNVTNASSSVTPPTVSSSSQSPTFQLSSLCGNRYNSTSGDLRVDITCRASTIQACASFSSPINTDDAIGIEGYSIEYDFSGENTGSLAVSGQDIEDSSLCVTQQSFSIQTSSVQLNITCTNGTAMLAVNHNVNVSTITEIEVAVEIQNNEIVSIQSIQFECSGGARTTYSLGGIIALLIITLRFLWESS